MRNIRVGDTDVTQARRGIAHRAACVFRNTDSAASPFSPRAVL
jgi:hypothetical protein